ELRRAARALAAAGVRPRRRRARWRTHGPRAAVHRSGHARQARGRRTPRRARAVPGDGWHGAALRPVPPLRAVPLALAEGSAGAPSRRLAVAALGAPGAP